MSRCEHCYASTCDGQCSVAVIAMLRTQVANLTKNDIILRDALVAAERDLAKARADAERSMIRGVVLGVAEMLRGCYDQRSAAYALRGAGITRAIARGAGCEPCDMDEIEWNDADHRGGAK